VPVVLRAITVVLALALAAWGLAAAARGRAPGRGQLVGVVVLEVAALVLVAWAAVGLVRGHRVHEQVTLYGYLFAFLLVPPGGGVLARLEPSRWGSVIIGVTGLVEAVLVVRLQQLWSGFG
jgi:hypothetical protein